MKTEFHDPLTAATSDVLTRRTRRVADSRGRFARTAFLLAITLTAVSGQINQLCAQQLFDSSVKVYKDETLIGQWTAGGFHDTGPVHIGACDGEVTAAQLFFCKMF
jgi:hypothetical protein